MDPVALRIGPITIYWYGLLIVIGAVVAAWIAWIEAKRRGENPEHIWNLVAWVLLLGLIGARLYHVISTPAGGFPGWDYYRANPIEIIAFWKSGFRGLGIFGAIVGGILAIFLYTRVAHLIFLRWTDIIARPSAGGATGSTRSCMAHPPPCPGVSRSTPPIVSDPTSI